MSEVTRAAVARSLRPWTLAALLALSVLLVWTLWVVPYLPTNDGPEWVYLTHVENHIGDPNTPYAAEYTHALQFASRGFTLLYRPFEAWLGWEQGLRVTLSVVVLLAAWSFVALVYAIDRRRSALGFLGFPLALSWHFYMGFWGFVVGSALGLLVLALAVGMERAPASMRARAGLSFLLFVQAVAHVFSAVLTGGALLLLAVQRAPRGRRARETVWVVLVGLPAALILLLAVITGQGQSAQMAARGSVGYLPWRTTLALFPQTLAPGPLWRAMAVTAVLVVGLASLVRRLLPLRRDEEGDMNRGLAWASVLLLAASLLAPVEVPAWSFFAQRFLPLGVWLLVSGVPLERLSPVGQRLASLALFLGAAAWLAVSFPFHRALATTVHDALTGLSSKVHRSRQELPIPLADAEGEQGAMVADMVPQLSPLLHMGALYAVELGGTIPSVFTANPAIHPLVKRPRPDPREPEWVRTPERYWGAVASTRFARDDAYRHDTEEALASLGMFYEGIVLFAARPDDVLLFGARGYVIDAQTGGTVLAHFRSCRFEVAVADAPPDTTGTFDVLSGNFQLVSNAHPPGRVEADGATHFEVSPAPCGELVVKARLSSKGVSGMCKNADPEQRLHATVGRRGTIVSCDGFVATP